MSAEPQAPQRAVWHRFKRPALWVISAALLFVLYRKADWQQVLAALGSLHVGWLLAALSLFVPQTLLSAWRWQVLIRPLSPLTLAQSLRHTLIASAFNLILPSKLGDYSKVGLLPHLDSRHRLAAAGWATLEKASDVAALLVWLAVGWLRLPVYIAVSLPVVLWWGMCTFRVHKFDADGRSWWQQVILLAPFSLSLWGLHLLQIDWMLKSAGVCPPWEDSLSRIPLAIFAGLLPISAMGLGTRDAALVYLFSPWGSSSSLAAVGLLTALRYLLPGTAGILCLTCWRTPTSSRDVESEKGFVAGVDAVGEETVLPLEDGWGEGLQQDCLSSK